MKGLKLDYFIQTESWSLKIIILNENGEEIKFAEKNEGTITIDETSSQKYILRIECHNHEGNYKILLNE